MYENHHRQQQQQQQTKQKLGHHDIFVDEDNGNMRLAEEAQAVESVDDARRIIEKYHLLIDS